MVPKIIHTGEAEQYGGKCPPVKITVELIEPQTKELEDHSPGASRDDVMGALRQVAIYPEPSRRRPKKPEK